MREMIPIDLDNKEHLQIAYQLAKENEHVLLNDFDPNLLDILSGLQRSVRQRSVVGYLCLVDGRPSGALWVELLPYNEGRIRGALLKDARNGFHAVWFFQEFLKVCFDELALNKIETEFEVYLRPVEKLLKLLKFKRVGVRMDSIYRGGKPENTILYELSKYRYKGLIHVQIKNTKHAKSA